MKRIQFLLLLSIFLISGHAFGQWQNIGTPAFSQGQAQYTSLAIYAGTPFVAYRDLANSNKCSVMKHDGTNWVYVGTPGISGGGALYTSLAMDNGFPFVAYVDGSSVNRVTVKAFNGTSWLTIGAAGFTGDNTSFVNLKFDGSTPYVAYQDGSNGNKASVMKFNGTSWEQVGVAGFSAGVATEISLCMLGATPYVSFKDANVSNELSVMYYDGASWQYLGTQGITSGGIGKNSIATDGTTIFVAFEDASNSDKLTVLNYSGSWQLVGTAGFSAGAADYIDMEFLGADPYVAYQDASYGFRSNVMWFDGADWLEIGVPGFTPSQALYTSLSFDGGYPLIAFQDYDGGTYKASVMKYEPCFDADTPTLSLSESTICKNMPLTLSVTSGNLNSADYWSVYTGNCGGTLVGSFSGSSAVLLPQGNTTYFVRGEPACVTPLACTTIAVNVTPIDSSVIVSGATLTAVSSGGTYEWLNCSTGFSVIAGQTGQSFTATSNGTYAMKITQNGCVDTSSCYTFGTVGLHQDLDSEFSVFPNPATEFITIQFTNSENSLIRIIDLKGTEHAQWNIESEDLVQLDVSSLEAGIYVIQVIKDTHLYSKQIVIN
jgi:hypothetical protein